MKNNKVLTWSDAEEQREYAVTWDMYNDLKRQLAEAQERVKGLEADVWGFKQLLKSKEEDLKELNKILDDGWVEKQNKYIELLEEAKQLIKKGEE